MKYFALQILKACMHIWYGLCRIPGVKDDRILFLSRQSSEIPLDFAMIRDELARRGSYDMVFICDRLGDGLGSKAAFAGDTLKAIRLMATSKVMVLDSYSIPVCVLPHKPSQTVIQIWHAIGKIKQSGYQTLGKVSGRDEKTARILHMHENYDIVIAGGEAWNKAYCASFNITEDKLRNVGLPRIDYLLSTKESNRERVLAAYPEFADKTVILYAPTFRRGWDLEWESLAEQFDKDKYAFVIKPHPNQALQIDPEKYYECPEFTSLEILSAADYLITDFSAIAVEAAAMNVNTYYYIFDKDRYLANNGLNLDIEEVMPACAFRDGKALAGAIQQGTYPAEEFIEYRRKYLPGDLGHSTEKIVDLIEEAIRSKGNGRQK